MFPLSPNDKEPAFAGSWLEWATTDETRIRTMWTDPLLGTDRDYNIGVDTTGMCVIDLDVKNGKTGVEDYATMHGHYETLVVQTPSGGYHCYFQSDDVANVSLSQSIDVRSHHGFVLAPGSVIDGVEYRIVRDRDMAQLPAHLRDFMRDAYTRTDVQVSLDSDASIEAAIGFLQSAPPAIEGMRGDDRTFQVAARLVNEFALSKNVAYNLLVEHYNPRCIPPWELDALAQKVENAASYGTAISGRLDPSTVYAGVHIEPPTLLNGAAPLAGIAVLDPSTIPPRPWLIDGLLMHGDVTALVAPGSAGKSSVSLALAAHLAFGYDFGPFHTRRAVRSLVYNGEDDVTEQIRKLVAACSAYDLDYNVAKQNITLWSDADVDLKLVVGDGRNARPNGPMIEEFVQRLIDAEIGFLVLDPLVDVHGVEEDSNVHMNVVMRVLRQVAREANVAILVCHHTSKAGHARQEDRVGNMDISRGASAILYKSRISFTLLNASSTDAEKFGFPDEERYRYARLDAAKMNLTLADGKPVWFRRDGIKLQNGEVIGALVLTDMKPNETAIVERVGTLLVQTMLSGGQGSMPLAQAVAVVKAGEPLLSNRKDSEVRQRLEGMFASPVTISGRTVSVYRADKDRAVPVITLT